MRPVTTRVATPPTAIKRTIGAGRLKSMSGFSTLVPNLPMPPPPLDCPLCRLDNENPRLRFHISGYVVTNHSDDHGAGADRLARLLVVPLIPRAGGGPN